MTNDRKAIVFVAGCVIGLMLIAPPWRSEHGDVDYGAVFESHSGRVIDWGRLLLQIAIVSVFAIVGFMVVDGKSIGQTATEANQRADGQPHRPIPTDWQTDATTSFEDSSCSSHQNFPADAFRKHPEG